MPVPTTLTVARESFLDTVGQIDAMTLVIAWSAEEPDRVGEIGMLAADIPMILGRGEAEGGEQKIAFVRQRPGVAEPGPPIAGAGISRHQLVVTAQGDGVLVESVGRCELRVNGATTTRAVLRDGDTLQLRRQLVAVCLKRPLFLPPGRYLDPSAWGEFGGPDANGIIGESPATWALREQIGFVGKSATHALLVGATGTGKELAARAIHALSGPAGRPLVERNAATLPPGLIDAELFGSARNYPNTGMPERPGLIGQADGGSLFLDEIAELPHEQQAHLLRVLDCGGQYQRLGEASTRRSDFRLIAATNRDPATLKHDLLARFASILQLTALSARREDIPLIVRNLVLEAARKSPEIGTRFIARDARGRPYARLAPGFVEAAIRQDLPHNTRQLRAAVWKAMSESAGDEIVVPSDWRSGGGAEAQPSRPPAAAPPVRPDPSGEDVRTALATAGGSVSKAALALGLPSRFSLYRLMKKHGIRGEDP